MRAGVVQRLVYLPSKEKMTVRFRSPAPYMQQMNVKLFDNSFTEPAQPWQ